MDSMKAPLIGPGSGPHYQAMERPPLMRLASWLHYVALESISDNFHQTHEWFCKTMRLLHLSYMREIGVSCTSTPSSFMIKPGVFVDNVMLHEISGIDCLNAPSSYDYIILHMDWVFASANLAFYWCSQLEPIRPEILQRVRMCLAQMVMAVQQYKFNFNHKNSSNQIKVLDTRCWYFINKIAKLLQRKEKGRKLERALNVIKSQVQPFLWFSDSLGAIRIMTKYSLNGRVMYRCSIPMTASYDGIICKGLSSDIAKQKWIRDILKYYGRPPIVHNQSLDLYGQPLRIRNALFVVEGDYKCKTINGVSFRMASPQLLLSLWSKIKMFLGRVDPKVLSHSINNSSDYIEIATRGIKSELARLFKSSFKVVMQNLISDFNPPEPLIIRGLDEAAYKRQDIFYVKHGFYNYSAPRVGPNICYSWQKNDFAGFVQVNPIYRVFYDILQKKKLPITVLFHAYNLTTMLESSDFCNKDCPQEMSFSNRQIFMQGIAQRAVASVKYLWCLFASSKADVKLKYIALYFLLFNNERYCRAINHEKKIVWEQLLSYVVRKASRMIKVWECLLSLPPKLQVPVIDGVLTIILSRTRHVSLSGCKSGKDRTSEQIVFPPVIMAIVNEVYASIDGWQSRVKSLRYKICCMVFHLKTVLKVYAQVPGTMKRPDNRLRRPLDSPYQDYGQILCESLRQIRSPYASLRNRVFANRGSGVDCRELFILRS